MNAARSRRLRTVDGNEAVASVAYKTNEIIAVYPITPASPMGEHADAWAGARRTNIWGSVPEVIEMQSEAGASGAVHGALQGGALTTTFTASQGLLLMIPNMYKIAGELTPTVFHIAARTVATHALSIFGDHSDVMAARTTGWAMLASNSVQEAHDMALIAQVATLESRVPFLHFFDGFRTSHEINKIIELSDDDLTALIPLDSILAHRTRRLDPDQPVLRGSAQNPDVFFQAREAVNPFYDAVPDIVQSVMDRFSAQTGRAYRLFDYVGHPEAERVVVLMGSGAGAAQETVDHLVERGERVGVLQVRLYRPFSAEAMVAALPRSVRAIGVLDRTKEPGAVGEPLYTDVLAAMSEEFVGDRTAFAQMPRLIGGRYGLSSKEFTPPMVKAVFDELAVARPKNHFTVGITDDVTGHSLSTSDDFVVERSASVEALFYGLGADGTVGANKNSVKIVGERTDLNAQGYFVYDSRKAGATTVSHLRFGANPIKATYLVTEADFVACHQFDFLARIPLLDRIKVGGTFLLNSPYGPDDVWSHLPEAVQTQIIDKGLEFFVVDGYRVAEGVGLGRRINTVLQACFFGLSGALPAEEAMAAIKEAIADTYGRFGESVLERNYAAVDQALEALHQVEVPKTADSGIELAAPVPSGVPDFVERVTAVMLAGDGDLLPVSAMPVDGTFPTGTTQYERRSIAREIPILDPEICIQCARCTIVCPHAAIRMAVFDDGVAAAAPETFNILAYKGKEVENASMTIQVAPDDCTGCGVCVDICPAKSKEEVRHKAINMEAKADHLEVERANWDYFITIPEPDRTAFRLDTVKGSQMLDPLFEFSGACAGCGETPYLKLMTQLFGDRVLVANATGCSSIYGGNLPTTPWRTNEAGRGPAWSNSLFEDNAEFGLGMRLALDHESGEARMLVGALRTEIGHDLASELLESSESGESGIAAQRRRVEALMERLASIDDPRADRLNVISGALVRKSVWIVGGDGWAYDIGFGGLDHTLASGRDVNILVLDTEVYSNTGGQASKATPRGAVAKYASSGKATGKKDLGQIAMAYGNVYVAQVAMGANNMQTIKAFSEAEAYPGPSLIIAYSTCIAHGIDIATSMSHQKDLVSSGYWPLYRFDPTAVADGEHAFHLDSRNPTVPFKEIAEKEARYAMLMRSNPEASERLMKLAQDDIDDRWELYLQLADIDRTPHPDHEDLQTKGPNGNG